jgi:hypothetical protein
VSTRTATRLAWAFWGLYLILAGLEIALAIYAELEVERADLEPIWLTLLGALGLTMFATTGALVAARRPENPIGWVMCGTSLVGVLSGIGEIGAEIAAARPEALPAPQVVAWFYEWSTWLAFGLSAIFLLLFPDGRPLARRWRMALWLAVSSIVLSILGEGLDPDPLHGGFENPLGVEANGLLETIRQVGGALLIASLAAAVLSLALRFRRAGGIERQQVKWLAFVVAAPIALVLPLAAIDWELAGGVLWAATLFAVLVGVPIATALAVLRYRLYDIDLIIRRTLVYGTATVALAGVYLTIVLLLQEVFSSFVGGSDLAIAASTLIAFALFRPIRTRIQALVDRRFYRRKYDAQRILETFAARLRDQVELDALETELADTVDHAMRPAHVSVWLRRQAT